MTKCDYMDGGCAVCHREPGRVLLVPALFVELLTDAVEAADDFAAVERDFRGMLLSFCTGASDKETRHPIECIDCLILPPRPAQQAQLAFTVAEGIEDYQH